MTYRYELVGFPDRSGALPVHPDPLENLADRMNTLGQQGYRFAGYVSSTASPLVVMELQVDES
jgi:hypothetical protein